MFDAPITPARNRKEQKERRNSVIAILCCVILAIAIPTLLPPIAQVSILIILCGSILYTVVDAIVSSVRARRYQKQDAAREEKKRKEEDINQRYDRLMKNPAIYGAVQMLADNDRNER